MTDHPIASKPLVALDHVGHSFDDGRIVALKEVSLTINQGDSVAIVGASGSGKSTLILLLCGIRLPNAGRVLWKGTPVSDPQTWTDLRRSEIAIVFQEFNLFPTLTARENIEVAMFGTGLGSRERRRWAPRSRWRLSVFPSAPRICRTSFQAASVSASPSLARSSTTPRSSLPTSPPPISTASMQRRSSISCSRSSAPEGQRW